MISRISTNLALVVVAAEAVFLVADQVTGAQMLHAQPQPRRMETATLIAWPIVAAALIVSLGRFRSGDRRYWVTIPTKAARQLTATGIPLAIVAVAMMTFGNVPLGGNMVGGGVAILAGAVGMAVFSAVAARWRFHR